MLTLVLIAALVAVGAGLFIQMFRRGNAMLGLLGLTATIGAAIVGLAYGASGG